jgi:hypothetical protein
MTVRNMGASLYEPINTYKPVAANIGIVDGPFEYLTVGGAKLPIPFTTRMTVVCLSNGDLFLHSPIKFDRRLANGLLGLGTVRHLVSPNQFHYAHIGEWAKAFPEAVSWASPRVRKRARARHVDVNFARDLVEASPPTEWRQEIDQTLFPGGYFKEFIFFHKDFKDADSRRYDNQHRTGQGGRALADGHKVHRHVPPRWSDFLRHAVAAAPPAAEGEGGNRKNPLVAAAAYFAQPWSMFRCRCGQNNP